MKIALYTQDLGVALEFVRELLESKNIDFVVNPATSRGFDLALSYGGDGTFLSCVRQMGDSIIPVMGINSGRLGFLSNVSKQNASEAIDMLVEGDYQIQNRTMLRVEAQNFPDDITPFALNEFSVQKSGTTMIRVSITIDGLPVGDYWADGIIVATPTGSTAYSMSVGGAIISPECRSFIISAVAPHNLNIRPLVISDNSVVAIKVEARSVGDVIATVDNREYSTPSGSLFRIFKADRELEIIKLRGSNFYGTIREKLLWGVDPRN